MIEGFNNPNWMMQADRVLKEIGKEKAQEYCKVWATSHVGSISKAIYVLLSTIFPCKTESC